MNVPTGSEGHPAADFRPLDSDADWAAAGWASEATEATAAKKLAVTFSVRFEPDDAILLRRAARLSGQTRSEFVRQSTLEAAKEKIAETPVSLSYQPLRAGQEGRYTHAEPSSPAPEVEHPSRSSRTKAQSGLMEFVGT